MSALMVGERSATPGWPRREPRCGWGPKKLPRHVVIVTKVQAIRSAIVRGLVEGHNLVEGAILNSLFFVIAYVHQTLIHPKSREACLGSVLAWASSG